MEDIFDEKVTPEQKAEFIRLMDDFLAKMQRMEEQSAQDWEEMRRTNAETDAILARLREQLPKAA